MTDPLASPKETLLARNTGTTRLRLSGDIARAKQYIGVAQTYMGWLRNTLALGGIDHGARHLRLSGGVVIKLLWDGVLNIVDIFVPTGAAGAEPFIGLYVCLGFDTPGNFIVRHTDRLESNFSIRGNMAFSTVAQVLIGLIGIGSGRAVIQTRPDPDNNPNQYVVYLTLDAGVTASPLYTFSSPGFLPFAESEIFQAGTIYAGEGFVNQTLVKRLSGFFKYNTSIGGNTRLRAGVAYYDSITGPLDIGGGKHPADDEHEVIQSVAYMGNDRLFTQSGIIKASTPLFERGKHPDDKFAMFYTDDFGAPWTLVSMPTLDAWIAAKEAASETVDKLLIASSGALAYLGGNKVLFLFDTLDDEIYSILSTDRGATFTEPLVFVANGFRAILEATPLFDDAVLIIVEDNDTLTLLRTIDAGATWQTVGPYPVYPDASLGSGFITPLARGVDVDTAALTTPVFDGQFRAYSSQDSGATWTAAGLISPSTTPPTPINRNYSRINAIGDISQPLPVNPIFPDIYAAVGA